MYVVRCKFQSNMTVYCTPMTLYELYITISYFMYSCCILSFIHKFNYSSCIFAFDFCWFCVVIQFCHPRHNGHWPPTSKDFSISDVINYIYFPILNIEKEPVFPFWMFSAKQGHYCYHYYNVFGMMRSSTGDWTRDLPHSKAALYH